jgi:hypothetical protein
MSEYMQVTCLDAAMEADVGDATTFHHLQRLSNVLTGCIERGDGRFPRLVVEKLASWGVTEVGAFANNLNAYAKVAQSVIVVGKSAYLGFTYYWPSLKDDFGWRSCYYYKSASDYVQVFLSPACFLDGKLPEQRDSKSKKVELQQLQQFRVNVDYFCESDEGREKLRHHVAKYGPLAAAPPAAAPTAAAPTAPTAPTAAPAAPPAAAAPAAPPAASARARAAAAPPAPARAAAAAAPATAGNGRRQADRSGGSSSSSSSATPEVELEVGGTGTATATDAADAAAALKNWVEDVLAEIEGMESCKQLVRDVLHTNQTNELRAKAGASITNVKPMHTIFQGPPGTGKTLFAEKFAEILKKMGVVNDTFIMVKATDMMGKM